MFDDFTFSFTGAPIDQSAAAALAVYFGQEDLDAYLDLTETDIRSGISEVRSELLRAFNENPTSAESQINFAVLSLLTQDYVNLTVDTIGNAQSLIEFYRDVLPFDLTFINVADLINDAQNAVTSGLGTSFDLFDYDDFPTLTVGADFTNIGVIQVPSVLDGSVLSVGDYGFYNSLFNAGSFDGGGGFGSFGGLTLGDAGSFGNFFDSGWSNNGGGFDVFDTVSVGTVGFYNSLFGNSSTSAGCNPADEFCFSLV
jgi:hypothetical protein